MSVPVWQMVFAALCSLALTPLVRRYSLVRGLVDRPGPRRSHTGSVPRGGGVALIVAMALGACWTPSTHVLVWLTGAIVIAMVGWLDDHAPLAVRWRLGIQVALASGIVAWLGPVDSVAFGSRIVDAPWLWTPAAVVAVVWLLNLFNFMDGSDGLATTQTLFSAAMFGVAFSLDGQPALATIAWLTAGAAAGFLYWNWPRASIFLGDSGSLLFGWCMAVLALGGAAAGAVPVWLSFIIVSPFVVDATVTLGWRSVRGERWYTPHTEHAYQYLIRAGWSHRSVLVVWIGLNALLVVPAWALVLWKPQSGLAVAAVLGVVLTGVWFVVHFVVGQERVTT